MDIRARMQELMSAEIDRTEFLHHMGLALLGVLGLTALFKERPVSRVAHAHGYGQTINLK